MRRSRRRRSPWKALFLSAVVVAVVLGANMRHRAPQTASSRYDVKKVVIDLGSRVRLEPAVARSFPGGTELFPTMVGRLKPLAAINGTYYDSHNNPLGDIVINGEVVKRGGHRHALAVTDSGRVQFVHRQRGRKFNWHGYRSALACGPLLVQHGKSVVNPEADGFSSAARTLAAWRSAVGLTRDHKLLMVVVENRITLDELASVMLDLGAAEAMNLDGGGACGLYHSGKLITVPGLAMTNILAVYRD